MSAWALVIDGTVVEITSENPAGRFHPDLQWVDCSSVSGVAQGWTYSGSKFAAPVPVALPPPTLAQQLAPSDAEMARVAEDIFIALLPTVTSAMAAAQVSAIKAKINARRQIRGEAAI